MSVHTTRVKPISFPSPISDEMIRAVLNSRKTMMRRVVKPQPVNISYHGAFRGDKGPVPVAEYQGNSTEQLRFPYSPGDILYVREAWSRAYGGKIFYRADYGEHDIVEADRGDVSVSANLIRWRPSVHMPKEAARIFLQVMGVRLELLHDITDNDVLSEGVPDSGSAEANRGYFADNLWDDTIKSKDRTVYGWFTNPWVWVIVFERIGKEAWFK